MTAATIIAIITGLVQFAETLAGYVSSKQLLDSGKAEAIASSLTAIQSKTKVAKDVEVEVGGLTDDDVAKRLRDEFK